MTRTSIGLVGVLVLIGGLSWVAAQSSPLEGAWAVQGEGTGLIVFSGQHYSMTLLNDTDRPDMANSELQTATADLLRSVFGPVIANAGTFELSGDTLTLRATVAKNTFAMNSGFLEFSCTLDGDTLELGSPRTEDGPLGGENPFPRRLTRVR